MPCCQTCSRTFDWDFKSGKKGWGWLDTSPIIFQQCFFAPAPHEFVHRPKDMIAKKAGRDYETMRDLSDFYQPDWQKGQYVEGLRFSEVCSETRKHWKPFEECTVQPQCTPGPLSFHRRITVCCVCCKSRSNTSSSWDEWNETAGIHSYGSWVRWKNPSAFLFVSQKWGHNWSVWSMSVSFGRRWLNVASNNHFSVLGCSIIYVMDYGLSWHGNPGNHFPVVTVQYHQLHFRLALSMKEQTSAGPSQPFDSNQVAHLCKFLKIP